MIKEISEKYSNFEVVSKWLTEEQIDYAYEYGLKATKKPFRYFKEGNSTYVECLIDDLREIIDSIDMFKDVVICAINGSQVFARFVNNKRINFFVDTMEHILNDEEEVEEVAVN